MRLSRRKFLAALAAGGIVTAEGLWVPGAKLISIPAEPAALNREVIRRVIAELKRRDVGRDLELYAIMHPAAVPLLQPELGASIRVIATDTVM